jgi:hypothetical protein
MPLKSKNYVLNVSLLHNTCATGGNSIAAAAASYYTDHKAKAFQIHYRQNDGKNYVSRNTFVLPCLQTLGVVACCNRNLLADFVDGSFCSLLSDI